MTTYLYIGDDEREFPGDGVIPSLHVSPGDHVEVDADLDPRYFEPLATGGVVSDAGIYQVGDSPPPLVIPSSALSQVTDTPTEE